MSSTYLCCKHMVYSMFLLNHDEEERLLWWWREQNVPLFPHSHHSCCFRWPPWNYSPAGSLISSHHKHTNTHTHTHACHSVTDSGAHTHQTRRSKACMDTHTRTKDQRGPQGKAERPMGNLQPAVYIIPSLHPLFNISLLHYWVIFSAVFVSFPAIKSSPLCR